MQMTGLESSLHLGDGLGNGPPLPVVLCRCARLCKYFLRKEERASIH